MRQVVGEVAVVRQEESAGRLGVEAADGHDARRVLDELHHRRTSLRVAAVVTTPAGLCRRTYVSCCVASGSPSSAHLVGGLDDRVQLPGRAVDGDAACLDQVVGLPA